MSDILTDVRCASCGGASDRGCIQLCRDCSPLQSTKYLHAGVDGHVVLDYRVSKRDRELYTLGDLHRAQAKTNRRRAT